MGSFREILPGSHSSVGRTPQMVNLPTAASLPAAGLQGNLCPGNRGRNWQATEDWEQQEGIWGKEEQQMGGGRNHSSGEGWAEGQWKKSSWENSGAGKSWGLRTRTSACICLWYWRVRLNIEYILIFKWRCHLGTLHPQKSWDLFMTGQLLTLPSVPPIGKRAGRSLASKSKGLFKSVLLWWTHNDKRKLIYLKHSSHLMWDVCYSDTIITVLHEQQSLTQVSPEQLTLVTQHIAV